MKKISPLANLEVEGSLTLKQTLLQKAEELKALGLIIKVVREKVLSEIGPKLVKLRVQLIY